MIRRPIGAASRVLPVITLLFLPIAFGMHAPLRVDPRRRGRARRSAAAQAAVSQHAVLPRARRGLFLVWNALSYFLNAWSLEQDRTGDPRIARRMQMLSGGGLVAYGLTITFASFDWLMSLEPHWFSTIYGVLIMGGQGLSAMAFLIIVLVWLSRRPPLDGMVVPAHFHDLGNLLLAFVMLWAYFSFSQYLIIWSGNLPEEIAWYLHRLQTGWRVDRPDAGRRFISSSPSAAAVAQRQAGGAAARPGGHRCILLARLVDLFWLIAPEFHRDGISVSWLDVVLPLTLGSIWLGCFIWQLRGRAILPVHDPQFDETLGRIIERGSNGLDGALTMTIDTGSTAAPDTRTASRDSDVNIRAIFTFGAGLLVSASCIQGLIWLLFQYFREPRGARDAPDIRSRPSQDNAAAARAAAADRPARGPARTARARNSVLGTYGWVDKDAGVVRIPIDEAMRITVRAGSAGATGVAGDAQTSTTQDIKRRKARGCSRRSCPFALAACPVSGGADACARR